MPHISLDVFRTRLPEYAIGKLGAIQSLLIQQVQESVFEVLNEMRTACPSPARLEQLSSKVNNIRQVVNSSRDQVGGVSKVADFLDPVIRAAKIFLNVQYHLPTFISSPVGVPVGFPTFAKTDGIINSTGSRIRKFEKLAEDAQDARVAIIESVSIVNGIFEPLLSSLDQIDSLIQACVTNQAISDEERAQLIKNVQKNTDSIYYRGIEYRSQGGATYTIKVIDDPNSPSVAPKRQAIAQDFRGITVLTGPSSFASNPQILLDELKFRIDNQLP